jgi:hypothetical protein
MKIKVYQICYSAETLACVPEGFHALDYTDNSRPDWREFWPIRQFLLNNYLSDDVLYGFFSPKFHLKTNLSHNNLVEFIKNHYQGEDLVNFSPFWDLSSIFQNVFEQGSFFHPGLSEVCQQFSNAYLCKFDLSNCINSSRDSIFCNYFLAKSAFWKEWIKVADMLYSAAEDSSSLLSSNLNALTPYGLQSLPMKIFVQERLPTICLLLNKFKTLSYNTFLLPSSTTPFNTFFAQAIQSDALKMAFLDTNKQVYFNQFSTIRNEIIASFRN